MNNNYQIQTKILQCAIIYFGTLKWGTKHSLGQFHVPSRGCLYSVCLTRPPDPMCACEHRDTGPCDCDALRAAGTRKEPRPRSRTRVCGRPGTSKPNGESARGSAGIARDRRRIFGAPPPRARGLGLGTAWRGLKPGALGSGSERWRPGALRARQDVKTRVSENRPI